VGIYLLLFPGWWGILAACHGKILRVDLIFLFAVGAVVMRAAGCVLNDFIDRNLDKKVARTKNRPLASGEISSAGAIIFMGLLLTEGLAVVWQLNPLPQKLGMAALLLVALYPWMKRFTWWPQAFLGITFNWGVLMGWAAVQGSIQTPAILLYLAGIFWTLG